MIQLMNSFAHYGSGSIVGLLSRDPRFAAVANIGVWVGSGRAGQNVIATSSSSHFMRMGITTVQDGDIYRGGGIYKFGESNASRHFQGFMNGNTHKGGIACLADGTLTWRNGAAVESDQVASTLRVSMLGTAWAAVEWEVQLRTNATGYVKVYVDGIEFINATNIPTIADFTANLFSVNGPASTNTSPPTLLECFYFGIATDWVGAWPFGNFRMQTDFPIADVESDFTPSEGSDNFAMVDDPAVDDDTTYNVGNVEGNADLFDFPATIAESDVFAQQLSVTYRKEDAGTMGLKTRMVSGVTEVNSGLLVAGTSYRTTTQLFVKDPNTGAQWTPAAANASRIGYLLSLT